MSALAGIPFPTLGGIIAPLIVWQMKRNEFPSVDEHGKESINFQLSILIYELVGAAVASVTIFFCIGFLLLPFFIVLFCAIHFGALVLAVLAGIKANDGVPYRYPLNLRLIK